MCGIVGYIGHKQALPVLLEGLHDLEYRGYDSAGIAVLDGKKINRIREVGKVDFLVKKIEKNFGEKFSGTTGIAHTRWATHGGVTEANAHPHTSNDGKMVIVHNGIIENYRELKLKLKEVLQDKDFESETDSEIFAKLIYQNYDASEENSLLKAVKKTLPLVRGTYGLVVMHADHPGELVAARLGSPLVIGTGEGEFYIASDVTPMLPFTKKVTFLDDGEVADINLSGLKIYNIKDELINKDLIQINWDKERAQKNGFENFMLKEIFDQPVVFEDAIRGRFDVTFGTAHLRGLNMTDDEMRKINRIVLVACGTASYACMVAKYAFEKLAGIPTEVDVAS